MLVSVARLRMPEPFALAVEILTTVATDPKAEGLPAIRVPGPTLKAPVVEVAAARTSVPPETVVVPV